MIEFSSEAANAPCACTILRRAARAATAIYDDALQPAGLRVTQFAILRLLERLGPSPVTRLAVEAALERTTMGRNLDLLERRSLVRIATGEADARERVVHLTAVGRAAIAAAVPYWRGAQARITEHVRPTDIAALATQLAALGQT